MRIGIFSECYHPTLNGVVVSVDTYKRELEKRGYEFFVFAPGTKGYKDEDSNHVFRYPSFCWPGQKHYPIGMPRLAPRQTKCIKDLKLDLIHTQHLFGMGKLGLRVGRSLGIPVIHTYHTLIAEYTHYVPLFSGIAKGVVIGMSRRYCNACDQVVTPSPSMKRVLLSYGIKTPIEPIPTGIELESFANPYSENEIKEKYQIPAERQLLLFVGRITKEKNIGFLLEAMKLLKEKRSDWHLLLCGGGPELKGFETQVASLGIGDHVTFAGEVPKAEVNRYFGGARIFTYPSITETQGIVITEAMAAGVPSVAVARMGPTDLITDGEDGFLVDLNIDEFTAKIVLLLDNQELWQKLSGNARENAKEYSTENSAHKMEALYKDVINRHHTR